MPVPFLFMAGILQGKQGGIKCHAIVRKQVTKDLLRAVQKQIGELCLTDVH
jgi:hypothetical protein